MPNPSANDLKDPAWQVKALSTSAAELAHRGLLEEATKIYEQILQAAPYHVQALDFLATRAYERGDTNLSLVLLGRSYRASRDRPITCLNLGVVHKARGEYELALDALDRALSLQAVYPMALLHKGSILEALGRQQEAVRAYHKAWIQAPEYQQKLRSEQIPAPVRELLSHSADTIRRARVTLLDKALAPLRSQHYAATIQRAAEFAELYVGNIMPRYTHAMQRPAFLYFPGLQPHAFFERQNFDWVVELEAATASIRQELRAVLEQPEVLKPYVQLDTPDPAQWKELNNSPQWSSFHLYKAGERQTAHCNQCPITAAIVEKLPLVYTQNHSPEIFFSILKPGTHIPPHYGLANYKLAVHLPLIVPADCTIRVGNESRSWTEGQCLIFDDSFQHEAWNNSSELRAVLILEVWNPQLSLAEQQAVVAVLSTIREFEREYGSG
ncbi:MAG: aspartyl/asparaginyl beta-hydroxylase domain-containing protein [Gammaproteobacteria bacterium]